MKNTRLTGRLLFVFAVSLFAISCGKSSTGQAISDYDKLCKINEDIAPKSLSPAVKGMDIAERIENDLPEFYKRDYEHIILLDRKDTYRTIKKIAERETKKQRDCEVMREYYSGKYDQSNDTNKPS